MELIQNRNSTQDLSDLVVSRWDSMPQMSSYDNNIIIVLGVLTFALQLCLALLVMRRCMNLDQKIREATECSQNSQKLQIVVPSSCQQDVSKQVPHRFYDDCFLTSPGEGSAPTGTAQTCLFGPYIHWDLVQN